MLLRGTEGFGVKHGLHTERLLTLSEDLPLVSVAVDTRERVERVLPEVIELSQEGLVTLERARLFTGGVETVELSDEFNEEVKLTVYCGRKERAGGRPAFLAVVELLRAHGVAGATALLGVDGTAHGMRRRARFFGANADVPLMVIAVGAAEAIAAALPELTRLLERPLMTLERVRVLKRDAELLAEPTHLPEHDDSGLNLWQKLMVHSGEQARHGGHPLYTLLIRRLREEGASGATALRGIWGYHGDHEPHGDKLLSLRRRVPILTTIVDRPERIRRWFRIVDELTDETGLVTSEMVPAFRANGPAGAQGGLELARYRGGARG